MVEPADETERSLPGVGIPVLGRPGVGIPDDRGFWFVDAYRDMADFNCVLANHGNCRSLHASSSPILRKATHRHAPRPQPVAVSHREAAKCRGEDNTRGLRSDPPIHFLSIWRKPCPTAPDAISSRCSTSSLAFARNRISTFTTRSKTKTRFSGAEEECVWSEDTSSSPG